MTTATTTFEDILTLPLYAWSWSRDEQGPKIEDVLDFACDLELTGESYSFDLLRFYVRKDDGQVLYATDSGCSCPAPFEDTLVADLKEVGLAGVPALVEREKGAESTWGRSLASVMQEVRDRVLPALERVGAR